MEQKLFRLLYPRQKPPKFEFDVIAKILTTNHMKLSANESLHCTDYEMVCDGIFFGCFTPGGSPKFEFGRNSENDVIIQTLGTSAGGEAAEKISVTYDFVISAM